MFLYLNIKLNQIFPKEFKLKKNLIFEIRNLNFENEKLKIFIKKIPKLSKFLKI